MLGLVQRVWLGLGVLVAVACSTDSRRADKRVEPAVPGVAPGRSAHESRSAELTRRWLLYVPRAAEPGEALPLVFNLHGSGGTPEDQLGVSGLEELAERESFVVVAPAAVEQRWNVPPDATKADDVRFFSELIDSVAALTPIDRQRVFATGFSGGGRMASQLACDLSERVAAIAAIGGIRFPGPCAQARPMPILAFHGTADDVNPYEGGGQPYWGTGVEPAVTGWAEHNRCTVRSEQTLPTGVREIRHGGSDCDAEVVLYRIEGFGHSWPRAVAALDDQGGGLRSGRDIKGGEVTANELLWRFFQSHPLPQK
jgi:polyhydroxybutyrate depolymerase